MSPNVPKKDSLDFLWDYYFDTKSPVAFTSPLALYRDPKNVILPSLFVRLKLGYNPKTPTPFINQFGVIFQHRSSTSHSQFTQCGSSEKKIVWQLIFIYFYLFKILKTNYNVALHM